MKMKRNTLLTIVAFFALCAIMAGLNARNGSKGQMISSALVVKASPTPATKSANANITTVKANANAATNVSVKVGNTNINADTSTRERIAKSNSNSKPEEKTLTVTECMTKVKNAVADAIAKVTMTPKKPNVKKGEERPKPTATKTVKGKIAPKPATLSKKGSKPAAKTPAKTTSKVKKPTGSKPITVVKKDSKSAKKPALNSSDEKKLSEKKKADPKKKADAKAQADADAKKKSTPNVDDTSPPDFKFSADKAEITVGESVTLSTEILGGTPPYILTDTNGDHLEKDLVGNLHTQTFTPTQPGDYTFTRNLTDKNKSTPTKALTIKVVPGKTNVLPETPWQHSKALASQLWENRSIDTWRQARADPAFYLFAIGLFLILATVSAYTRSLWIIVPTIIFGLSALVLWLL